MKELAILFMLLFVLPVYSQETMSIIGYEHYWYNIDTSKDTIEVDGKIYIHTPQYDTLVVDNYEYELVEEEWTKGHTWWVSEWVNHPIKYLIIEDIRNNCSSCGNTEIEENIHIALWSYIGNSAIGMEAGINESFKLTTQICKSCGNIYVARKQVLRRIE